MIAAACVSVAANLKELEDSTRRLIENLARDADLSGPDLKIAQELAEQIDNEYLDLHARGNDEEVLALFYQARLLTALAIGFGDASFADSEDAVYELSRACSDPDVVYDFILIFRI